MADTYTTNLNLTKPEPGAAEDTWGISLNADLDALDAIFSSSGTQINLNPNEINFADNKKAIFGTGSDLQIYHDGANSFIDDSGTGNLYIRANNLWLQKYTGETFIKGVADAEVTLYHNNQPKLATTSTGLDVTGTVTADGLTVSDGTNGIVQLGSSNTRKIAGGSAYGGIRYYSDNDHILYTNNAQRISINSTGDISFYDDTGSTQGLFWDAGTERLGIGATSLTHTIHVVGSHNEMALFKRSVAGNSEVKIDTTTSGDAKLTFANNGASVYTMGRDNSDGSFRIASGGTIGVNDRLVINSSGNVGIGTDSPARKLHVEGTTSIVYVKSTTSNANASIWFNSNVSGTQSDRWEVGTNISAGSSFEVYDRANSASRMTIDSSGNVVIGGTISSGTITTSGTLDFTANPATIRNNQDTSGQILISVLNGASSAKIVRWDAGNVSDGAWRPDVTNVSDLGLTNRIWKTLFVNEVKIGSGNTTVIDSSRNLINIGSISCGSSITATGTITTSGNVNLRNNTTGDGSIIKDINWYNSSAQGTDDRLALIRVVNEGGDSSTRGGQLRFYTRQSGSANFNQALTINKDGNSTFSGTISSGAITSSASITASGNSNNFGNTTIAALSATSGTFSASITASGNSNSFGNSSFGTISSGTITTSGNVNINTANDGLYFSGGNNRIYFNNHRAMEGATDGGDLQIAEGYTTILAQADVHLGNGKEIRLYDADGSAYTGIKAKTATSSSGTYQLPASLPSNSGAVLISTTAGELSWSSNTVSTYTNGAIASNRVITSNGPSSIEAESNLTFDNETLLVNHATGKVQIGATNAVQPEIIFKTGAGGSPRIKFDDGSVAAYIGYGHGSLQGEKLTISSPTTEITGDLNLSEYIYHTGDTDTYIRIQDNSWTFRTGGGDRVIIDNSNVQITNNLTLGTPDDHILMRLTDNDGAQFGFDPEYDHHLVITNEQGTTSQAMFLADTGDSGNDIWGVTRTIQGPTSGNTTGNEVWSKVLTLHGNGNLYTTGNIANEQFTIPNSAGSAGQVLKWPSSGTTLEWGAASGGTTTTINNNANNRVITGSGTADTLEAESNFTYDGTNLDVTGNIRATGDVTAFHSSDARLKDNVTVIDSALNKVKQIRGVEFDWNDKQDAHEGHDIGVIAQEVEQVAPELVKDRQDGYKAVDYPKLTALLIEAVKELELKVKELEEKQK